MNNQNLSTYIQWRLSLIALDEETILLWVDGYDAFISKSIIKAGQYTKIVKINSKFSSIEADFTYDLILCDSSGKAFKKKFYWSVENIASRIDNGTIKIK